MSEELSAATRRRQGVAAKDGHGLARPKPVEVTRARASEAAWPVEREVPKPAEMKADPVPELPPIHVVHNRKIHYGELNETGVSHPPDEAIRTSGEEEPPAGGLGAESEVGDGVGLSGMKPGPIPEAVTPEATARTATGAAPAAATLPMTHRPGVARIPVPASDARGGVQAAVAVAVILPPAPTVKVREPVAVPVNLGAPVAVSASTPRTPSTSSGAVPSRLVPAVGEAALAVAAAQPSAEARVAPAAHAGRIEKAEKIAGKPLEVKATVPVHLARPLYTRHGRLIVPPALKGSREILVRQNEIADKEGLDRIQDEEDLEHLRRQHLLVALPSGRGLEIDERLPLNRRYCRPWTAQFLTALGKAHEQRFHTPLQVNSAVRTVEFQERLRVTNGNAAPAEGEAASPHLTGQAIDLAKHGLSTAEIAWLRDYLLPLVQAGKVDVEEEFQQACFHISVYKKYAVGVKRKGGL